MRYPSADFDAAIADLCHGTATETQMMQLHELLKLEPGAQDEYLWQIEMHSRLASNADMRQISWDGSTRFAPYGCRTVRRRVLLACWLGSSFVVALVAVFVLFIRQREVLQLKQRQVQQEQSLVVFSPAIEPTKADKTNDKTNETVDINDSTIGMTATAGLIRENVRFAVALDAPVIAGTGPQEPLPVGAYFPYARAGTTLHVWNWSQSKVSRVFKDIPLFEAQRFAVAPAGNLLVTSQGRIINLQSGEITQIELGDEFYSNQGDTLRRIQGLQFSPDGGRLAVLVTNIEVEPGPGPLMTKRVKFVPELQILRFPSGQLLSKCPPGHGTAPRWAFTRRGDRIVTASPPDALQQQLIERHSDTGEVIRTYEPAISDHAYALAYAPDASKLAVYEGTRTLLIWETESGKLLQRIESIRHESMSSALRFSPDGQFLAVNATINLFIVDVVSGKIVATLPQTNAHQFQWSADGSVLTVITGTAYYEGTATGTFNQYPAVYEWNWRDKNLIRAYDSAPPAAKVKEKVKDDR